MWIEPGAKGGQPGTGKASLAKDGAPFCRVPWDVCSVSHGLCFYISVLFCSLRNHIYLHISLAPSDPLFEIWRTDNPSGPIGWGFTPNAANSMGERNGNIHVTYTSTSFHIRVTTEAHPEGGRKSLEKGDCRMNRHPQIVYYRGIYRNIDHATLRSSFIYVSSW